LKGKKQQILIRWDKKKQQNLIPSITIYPPLHINMYIHNFVNTLKDIVFASKNNCMQVIFKQAYLMELYKTGKAQDKKHRYQQDIIRKYMKVIDLMIVSDNVLSLTKYGALHDEYLHGNKEGLSSVRVNNK